MLMVTTMHGSPTVDCARFGVNEMLIWDTDAELDRTFSMMHAAGIEYVRVNWAMQDVQRAPGVFDFSRMDNIAAVATKYGVAILPILLDPTASLSGWLVYVRAVVSHFSNWRNWEVGNEENLKWSTRQYLTILSEAYRTIKSANPNATVILGGLANADADYLATLYLRGAELYFDVVSIHFYTDPATGIAPVMQAVDAVRTVMTRYGDKNKPIWLTEIGWSAAAPGDQAATAAFLTDVYTVPIPVEKIFWYNFRNVANAPSPVEANYGLLNADFTPKPAYAAYKALSVNCKRD